MTRAGQEDIADVRKELGEDGYLAGVDALRLLLCEYFDAEGCISKGANISPIGANSRGGKILKVRWVLPNRGKSGGLRLCFAAYCEQRVVVLCRAFVRKDEPKTAEFDDAGELAAAYAPEE